MISDAEQSRSDIILEMENRFMFAGRRRLCVAPRADTSGPCGLVQLSIDCGSGYARLHLGRTHTYARQHVSNRYAE